MAAERVTGYRGCDGNKGVERSAVILKKETVCVVVGVCVWWMLIVGGRCKIESPLFSPPAEAWKKNLDEHSGQGPICLANAKKRALEPPWSHPEEGPSLPAYHVQSW